MYVTDLDFDCEVTLRSLIGKHLKKLFHSHRNFHRGGIDDLDHLDAYMAMGIYKILGGPRALHPIGCVGNDYWDVERPERPEQGLFAPLHRRCYTFALSTYSQLFSRVSSDRHPLTVAVEYDLNLFHHSRNLPLRGAAERDKVVTSLV